MHRIAISRSLMLGHPEPKNDARICCSSPCICDVSVASLSAVSRCWRSSGSSNCCTDELSQTALDSWLTTSVTVRSWSSSRNTTTHTLDPPVSSTRNAAAKHLRSGHFYIPVAWTTLQEQWPLETSHHAWCHELLGVMHLDDYALVTTTTREGTRQYI